MIDNSRWRNYSEAGMLSESLEIMAKAILIGILTLLVVCMVPIMGTSAHPVGHLHHDASASCATCMGTVSIAMVAFSLPLLFILIWLLPMAPPLRLCRDRFHPPYAA